MPKIKKDVPYIAISDGVETGRGVLKNRVVFVSADGTEHISYLGGKKQLEGGVAIYRSAKLQGVTVQELLGRIQATAGGGPVLVIGMFDRDS